MVSRRQYKEYIQKLNDRYFKKSDYCLFDAYEHGLKFIRVKRKGAEDDQWIVNVSEEKSCEKVYLLTCRAICEGSLDLFINSSNASVCL